MMHVARETVGLGAWGGRLCYDLDFYEACFRDPCHSVGLVVTGPRHGHSSKWVGFDVQM